ncbi:MAG: hypothetical protein WC803_01625 [Sphingomonas sp.]|jgi:hypothetical protein
MRSLWIVSLALLAGCSLSPHDQAKLAAKEANSAQKIAARLEGLVPGKPMDCLDTHRLGTAERFGNTILYVASRKLIYRNDTSGGCFGLERGDAIVTSTTQPSLCRGDIIRTVDFQSGIQSGSCSFGEFIPYTKK